MRYAYYPGCSLERNSAAYDVSIREVCRLLDLEMREIDDWNCCGATEYFSQDKLTASAVIARNLALVERDLEQVVAPCAACFLNLKKTDHEMVADPEMGNKVNACLQAGGLHYQPGRLEVRHLLDVICNDVGQEKIRNLVSRPLTGLRIAPYYGCQVVRPLAGFDNPEYPTAMDELFRWCGAEVVDYPVKAHCCGGHMTQISEDQSFELIRRLLQNAAEYETDVILCLCPMCQLNLDAYQSAVNKHFGTHYKIPILFFTQLLGVALGINTKELGFGKEIVPAEQVIESRLKESLAGG